MATLQAPRGAQSRRLVRAGPGLQVEGSSVGRRWVVVGRRTATCREYPPFGARKGTTVRTHHSCKSIGFAEATNDEPFIFAQWP